MFLAILILLILPVVDSSKSRGIQFKPLQKIFFFMFVSNIIFLMQVGAKHVESPFIELGQFCTIFYFLYFLIITPYLTLFENALMSVNIKKTDNLSSLSTINIKNIEDIYNFNRSGIPFLNFLKKVKSVIFNKKILTFVFRAITFTIIYFIIRFLFQKYLNINLFVFNVDGNSLHNFIRDFFFNFTGFSISSFFYISFEYIINIFSEHISNNFKFNITEINKNKDLDIDINTELIKNRNSFFTKNYDNDKQLLYTCTSGDDNNFTGNISGIFQCSNPPQGGFGTSNPQGELDYNSDNNNPQGFFFDQVRSRYIINDPTRVRPRGYIDPATGQPYPSSQPYLRNLASALSHSRSSASIRGEHLMSPEREMTYFSNEDLQFISEFMRHEYPLRQSSSLCNTSTVRDTMVRKP
jgi:ubiquinol-cytochrome c reductase cytochrome b subunit